MYSRPRIDSTDMPIKNCKTCRNEFNSVYTKSGKGTQFCCSKCYGQSLKGKAPYNKGTGWINTERVCKVCAKSFFPKAKTTGNYCSKKCSIDSIEWRTKIRQIKLANPVRYWLGKARLDISGENNWKWRGGVTGENKRDRKVFRGRLHAKLLKRDNFTCQICGQYGGYLQVDHIMSWRDHPELRFKEENCRTLCMACHYYITFKKEINPGLIWGHNLKKSGKELS
jgi:5-methylcytosine-specific restriction endonuclease McrA